MPQVGREILAGSISASFTASIFSPLEMVKTRLMVQADPAAEVVRCYRHGFLDALRSVLRTDGICMVYTHGFAGFVLRDFFYSGLRIGLYPSVRSLYAGNNTAKSDVGIMTKILAGATTGAVGSAIANPFDIVRVRMTVEGGVVRDGLLISGLRKGNTPRYRSSWHCFRDTMSKEGIRGLYRGVEATSARAALLSAGQLASYDHTKSTLIKYGWQENQRLHIFAAIVSGIVSSVVCNPADVVKSRLMLLRGRGGQTSLYSVIRYIFHVEGIRGFYSGWPAAYSRHGPSFFIQMPIVEAVRTFLGVGSL